MRKVTGSPEMAQTHIPFYHNGYLLQVSLQNTEVSLGYNPGSGEHVRVGQGIKNRGGSFFYTVT